MKNYIASVAAACLFFCAVNTALCQSVIKGDITDKAGKPLAYANVLLLNGTDSSLVKGTVAGENGSYQLSEVIPGSYLLTVRMMGYSAYYFSQVKVVDARLPLELATAVLEEDVDQLQTVVVEGQKPLFEQQIDKLVVNVQSSISSQGGSVLEVLEKSPGLSVNRQNGSLSMNGKDGVLVMINGKTSRLPMASLVQMLSGLSAANVEKIELITSPPAKYDAEGDAGLINIVLREHEDAGTSGTLSLTGGWGHAEKTGAGFGINHRTKKLNVYGDYSFLRNHTSAVFDNYRIVSKDGAVTETSAISHRDPIITNHNARFGLDYSLGKKTIVGAVLSGYSNKWVMNAQNNIQISKNQHPHEVIDMSTAEVNHWTHAMANFNVAHQLSADQAISFDADYLYYHDTNPSDYLNLYRGESGLTVDQRSVRARKETPIRIWVAKMDYSAKLSESIKVEAGIKSAISRFTNDVSIDELEQENWITDPQFSNIHQLQEDIGAAYSTVTAQLTPTLDLVGGLRYEYTNTSLNSRTEKGLVDREYGKLFPNLSLAKKLNEHNKLNISYSRRITRPTFNDMAPFIIFMDPYTFFSGNASIQPAITDAFKFDYVFREFLLSLQYSYDDNAIARYQPSVDEETNIQVFTAQNLNYKKTASLTLSVPVSPFKFWEIQNNLMLFQQGLSAVYKNKEVEAKMISYRINSSHNIRLPYNFAIELTGFYQSPTLFGVAMFNAYGAVNAGIQKKLGQDRGVLSLSISDIFWTNVWSGKTDRAEENLVGNFNYYFEPRDIRLTYSLNFGNKVLKNVRKRKVGSEEERSRVTN